MIAAAFGGVSGGTGTSGEINNGVNTAIGTYLPPGNQGNSRPAAYLNYILFDKNYKVIDMGWQLAPATTFTKQKLQFTTINIKEPGYLFTYLSYDDDSNNWVYFDDFKVTHTKTNVLQYNEYYPFGLRTNSSWTRDNSKNNLLYNDASELNELTSFYDLAFRQYDPTIGRFLQADPLAVITESFSPYQYARNNPALLNDPLGLTDNVMLMEALTLSGGTEYSAAGGGGRSSRYATPYGYGPVVYCETCRENRGEYVSALDVIGYDPTYQNVAYREKAFQAIRDYGQQGDDAGVGTNYRWFDYTAETRAAIVTNIPFVIMFTEKGATRPAQKTILVTVMIQLPKTYAISSDDFEKRAWMNPNEASQLTDASIRTAHLETVMTIRSTDLVGLESNMTNTFTKYLENQLSMRFPGVDLPGVPGARVISRQNIPSQYMVYATQFEP